MNTVARTNQGTTSIKVSVQNANSVDAVKNLLVEAKELAIFKLEKMISLVNNDFSVQTYMKLFPVFFGYAETNKICITHVISLLEKLNNHPQFTKYNSLFEKWHIRFNSDNLITGQSTSQNERSSLISRKRRAMSENRCTRNSTEYSNLIGYADLDYFIALYKWLRYHKLHKYVYFFANISYDEMMGLNQNPENILDLDTKVGIFPITTGGRGTILRRMSEELHSRVEKLKPLRQINYYDTEEKIKNCLSYLKKVLHTPIRKQPTTNVNVENLPALLETVITTVVEVILAAAEPIFSENVDQVVRVLQSAYSCYFFTYLQKIKFNNLRCRIINIASRIRPNNRVLRPSTDSPTSPENETEEDKLEKNFALMEAWILKLIL